MSFVDHTEDLRNGLEFDAGTHAPPVVSYFQVTFFPGYLNGVKFAKVVLNAVTHLRIEELVAFSTLLGIARTEEGGRFDRVKSGINPLDFRFNKVSGLSTTVETDVIAEGGFNNETMHIPSRVSHENLVLQRGFIDSGASLTSKELSIAMNQFISLPGEILVTLNDPNGDPIEAWLFRNAIPVKWENSGLDSDENDIFMESMEFAYSHRHQIYARGDRGQQFAHILY